ncbi:MULTISPECIES: helix-turn-helix domain-containing protein [unclassified Staphylococcus]|uniref:helix-turn-helix domain-containing protein n=1 Tax=unclassified Staphylococcus TaxID=91994 RepID=UPI0021D2676B|nr:MULTISPECIES: helix-turn-helix domain-containing protein [unclassified Staphylococcus]UXR68725.1 helix-turn-helix domain-containing protein [Staphylococcus sp. IVB6246]UXR70781.1 helix-turn-helix domain-containing protein [Staphylococcus sp. IVB6240]UXR73012.1 helix-turn-helix domain-containing protein [Staphylococcus sp. IVB6238]UXR75307.1 helix-turn-helix domain-containing protein [Staphylococcus sp. IVB6233]UXR79509.1 helix-turn-helix domain-containing protein [Staphylococcus sp. IVB6218
MKSIISYAYQHAHPYKNKKSIYNIIIGKKTHQTFFDATSLNLLSLFGSIPNLSFKDFENITESEHDMNLLLPTSSSVTYTMLQHSFITLQLLIQTLSQAQHQEMQFIPLTSQTDIHQRVRYIYLYIKKQQREETVKLEIHELFDQLNKKHSQSIVHYFLTGYDETMYTMQQVAQINKIDHDTVFKFYYQDLMYIYELLSDKELFPILHHCLSSYSLSHTLARTESFLFQGLTVTQIANRIHLTENTIHDHILELFMRGHLTKYEDFLTDDIESFLIFYQQQPYQRLRFYKEHFDQMSYFEIKLAIVGLSKGALHA